MCGRYVVARTLTGALPDLLTNLEGWNPEFENFNIPPSSQVPIVVEDVDPTSGDQHREATLAHWGFVPVWKKSFAEKPQPINARIETVSNNGMFRTAFRHRHCLVPASGYYEWRVGHDGVKQPFYIRGARGAGLAMAGLYEDWIDESIPEGQSGRVRRTTTIITRAAIGPAAEVHDRMPVVLSPGTYEVWLSEGFGSADETLAFLDSVSGQVAGSLELHPVGRDVGNVRNNGSRLIEPIPVG